MLPIILAHGIARFDFLREKLDQELDLLDAAAEDEFHYFKNIRNFLVAHGFPAVFHSDVDFAGPVTLRAEQLKNQIERILFETGALQVHIIAHSMGGLDARRMIVDLGMAEKTASLTTIGTPHLGTPLADRVIAQGGSFWIDFLHKALRLNLDGFRDLTVQACREFNARAEESEAKNGVVYQTCSSFEEGDDMFLPLTPSWLFLRGAEGRNDGLVPVRSQQWTGALRSADGAPKRVAHREFPVRADHLNQVGWWDLEEAVNPLIGGSLIRQKKNYEQTIKQFYLEIARAL